MELVVTLNHDTYPADDLVAVVGELAGVKGAQLRITDPTLAELQLIVDALKKDAAAAEQPAEA